MAEGQFILELTLIDPYGKHWSTRFPIDSFEARDRYVDISLPDTMFDPRMTMDRVAQVIRKREYRKDHFERMAMQLAHRLGERMEDEEGWHGESRQSTYERMRREGKA